MTSYAAILPAIVYAVLGMVILGIGFVLFDMLTPGKLWTIIREEKNTAVAQFAGLFALALALIVASAIHG